GRRGGGQGAELERQVVDDLVREPVETQLAQQRRQLDGGGLGRRVVDGPHVEGAVTGDRTTGGGRRRGVRGIGVAVQQTESGTGAEVQQATVGAVADQGDAQRPEVQSDELLEERCVD